ncbi:MAG TPA: family 10 glycosylhydrolase, partial [Phycisphaerae bacterium]|nr:family 10 glycosylhydrolase [Phycisphaerae bacterium]
NDYVWIAPGVPEFQAYIRKQVLHVVENYDVDGVHFDRIRTPNSNFSYDPISQARRASPQSNPNNLDFSHWTRDQITRNVRDIYAAIMAVKPHVVVSAAVFPDPFSAPAGQHQDALTWAQTGGLDMIVPMMYSAGGEGSTWDNRLKAWLAGSAGRQVVAGQITSVGTSTLLTQVDLTRTRAAAGNSVFSISSFASWADYLASVYQAPAALPAMAWKSAPEHGIIIGYVTGAAGEAVVDAQLRRDGSDYVGLSSGDGFYSFLLVPPGTYRVQASHPGYGTVQVENVSVAAGQVVRRDINLGERLLPVIAKVEPDPDSVIGGREYIRQLSLIQGIVDTWTLVEGPPGAVINGQGQISGWFPQVSQIGQLFTFTVRATGPDGSDDETWQVRVVPPPPCLIHRFTGFEGHNPGTRVLFQLPRYSGTTGSHLATSPNVSEVTDEVTAFKGDRCLKVQWQFVDTATSRWMRLTASNGPVIPNPTVPYDRPIRFRLRVDHGSFRLCVGIRETNTTAAIGEDGGSEGPIEWVGAAASNGGAPQGRLVQAQPGVWQTFEFNPLTDPVVSFTGDGHLPVDGKGVFEHIAFASVGDPGPFTVYIDDIDLGCYSEPFGDFNRDGHVDALDLSLFAECASGPSVPLQAGCEFADANGDGFVDVNDFAAWQRCYSGVLPQLDPDCAP